MNSLQMKFLAIAAGVVTISTMAAADIYDFNKEWLFLKQAKQIPARALHEHQSAFANAKADTAGTVYPFAGAKVNESSYKMINLPHDWAVEDGFYKNENSSQGFRRRGWGYYRKHFIIPEAWRGKHIEIQFDGIATEATFWYNNTPLQHNYSGYNSVTMDLTPMAKYNKENIITVEVNADKSEGWWYEGAGIYRDTRIIVSEPCHIETEDGIYVNPVFKDNVWTVSAEIEVVNYGSKEENVTVEYQIEKPDGTKSQFKVAGTAKSVPFQTSVIKTSFKPEDVQLWSTETPNLYKFTAVTTINGKETDRKTVNFGYRTFRFDAQTGFYLNGKHLTLQGTCNHQDHAGVGVAVPAAIEEFRILKLKELGTNAYRCSHNPPSRNILDLCDKYGLVVIDENRSFNAGKYWASNIEWLVKRDRNHPCVVAWSIFNEEPLQGGELGEQIARYLIGHVHKYDTTRPTIGAMNGGFFDRRTVRNVLDMVGFNYQYGNIERFHREHPDIPCLLTEGSSAFETRGEYTTDRKKLTCTMYDEYGASWGSTHRYDWKMVTTHPFLAGTFVWTGFDYHGEPTPYGNDYPANSSYFGIMDMCGFPKNAFYLRQAMWLTKPVIAMIPHWTWPGKEGQPIKVFCSTNAEQVKFVLNDKEIGTFDVDKVDMLTKEINYEPGKLVAIGLKNGKEIARTEVVTTSEPVALKLEAFKQSLNGDGYDATPITISAVDKNGNVVPDAANMVTIEVAGGRNIGVGNGNPCCIEPEKGNTRSLFHGLAQVIVQSNEGTDSPIEIKVSANGLKSASCGLNVKKVPAIPSLNSSTKK